jgi:hypothetical protein
MGTPQTPPTATFMVTQTLRFQVCHPGTVNGFIANTETAKLRDAAGSS